MQDCYPFTCVQNTATWKRLRERLSFRSPEWTWWQDSPQTDLRASSSFTTEPMMMILTMENPSTHLFLVDGMTRWEMAKKKWKRLLSAGSSLIVKIEISTLRECKYISRLCDAVWQFQKKEISQLTERSETLHIFLFCMNNHFHVRLSCIAKL